MSRVGRTIRRRWPRLLRGCGHGLLPQRKGFPVGGDAHAAKDECRRRLEQGMAAVFPFRLRANDAHAVGAERKYRKCCCVGKSRLPLKALYEWRKAWRRAESTGDSCLHVPVPEARMMCADVPSVLERHENCDERARSYEERVGERLLHTNRKSLVVECNGSHWYMLHHRPDGREVFYPVLFAKMPAETIGRSLSGGVTDWYCTKFPCVAQGGRARKTSA